VNTNNTENSAGTNANINYEYGQIREAYFNRGNTASDVTAFGKFNNILDTADLADKTRIFSILNSVHHTSPGDSRDWDQNDLLNKVLADSSDAKAFLDKLDQLIELYEKGMTAVEIINEM
jgi:hypothetical protein